VATWIISLRCAGEDGIVCSRNLPGFGSAVWRDDRMPPSKRIAATQ